MYLRLALARNTYNSRPCDYAMSRPVPTCARAWPSRAAAVKDGALQCHRRLVLDRREHGGMLAVQRDKEKRRRGAHPTELFQLMLGFLLRAALEFMKSPTDSLEDPSFLYWPGVQGCAHGSSVNNFISRIEGPNIVAVNIFAV
jgi:hypothetical protein